MKYFILFFLFAICNVQAQTSADTLPRIFILGEHTDQFESLFLNYDHLLSAVDNDTKRAYNLWSDVLNEMDLYSEEIGVDLKGIQLMMYVFWDKSGNIKHLAYYLKPTSKNVEYPVLTAFFKNFVKNHQLSFTANKPYYLFSQASFPTFARRLSAVKQKKN